MGTRNLDAACTIVATDKRDQECNWLSEYRTDVFSQSGEDGVIEKIFEVIGTKNKWVVEFGAGNGVTLSNSRNLILNHEWSGVLIEPSGAYNKLEELYQNTSNVHVKNMYVGLERDNCLDKILTKIKGKVPKDLDFLSIDVDGCDLHIFHSLQKYKPRVVCIEFNHFIGNDVYYIQPADFSINHGSSLLAITSVAKELGYELVAVTNANAFFVERVNFNKFNISDNHIDKIHYNQHKETKILQMPSGDLKLVGLDHHPWKGFMIDEERLQVLPSNMREWKFNGRIWPQSKKDII